MLYSVPSFSWVWWVHRVTLVTFTAVGVVRTTGYGHFHVDSRLWVRMLFTTQVYQVEPVGMLRSGQGHSLADYLMNSPQVLWQVFKDLRRK